eukprot:1156560-Pelagomonas_calceolata.AAC.4
MAFDALRTWPLARWRCCHKWPQRLQARGLDACKMESNSAMPPPPLRFWGPATTVISNRQAINKSIKKKGASVCRHTRADKKQQSIIGTRGCPTAMLAHCCAMQQAWDAGCLVCRHDSVLKQSACEHRALCASAKRHRVQGVPARCTGCKGCQREWDTQE